MCVCGMIRNTRANRADYTTGVRVPVQVQRLHADAGAEAPWRCSVSSAGRRPPCEHNGNQQDTLVCRIGNQGRRAWTIECPESLGRARRAVRVGPLEVAAWFISAVFREIGRHLAVS